MLLSQFLPERRAEAERAFLEQAVAHFCATRCPLTTDQSSCPLLTWRESPHHMGALEKVCAREPGGRPVRRTRCA